MTFVNEIRSFEAGLVNRMRASFDELRAEAARRRVFRETVAELDALTDRDLDDLDISRLQIRDIAREAAYGK
jgi:uncharacterized protein YjiS (DUF1127 family)